MQLQGRVRMKTPEVAEYVGVKPTTVNGWRFRGKGPLFWTVGGSVYYWKDDVDQWLREQGAPTG